jgi:hypothetical protein
LDEVGVVSLHAALWHGTAASFVDLHPPGYYLSAAEATSGQEQVGYVQAGPSTQQHAVLWRGSAQSMVMLEPTGAVSSDALAAVPGLQGGSVQFPTSLHAGLWSGTAASFVDLNPSGVLNSWINGMAPGQQVGAVTPMHAALWRGTAASFMDLNPPGAGISILYGTCGTAQVGYANTFPWGVTAGIWFGTPESFVPLAPSLPPGYEDSVAKAVYEQNGVFYVGGLAWNIAAEHYEAFLWVGVPEPAGMSLLGASLVVAARRRRSAANPSQRRWPRD